MQEHQRMGEASHEDNPYAPPRQSAPAEPTLRRPGRVYSALNLAYAGVIALCALAIFARDPGFLDGIGAVVAAAWFLAPVACYGFVRWGRGHFRWFGWPYGAFVLLTVALLLGDVLSGDRASPVIVGIIAINVSALACGHWQVRRPHRP